MFFFFFFLKDEEFSFSSPENFEFFGFSLTWRHCEYFFWKILTANEIFLLKNWIPFISLCLPVGWLARYRMISYRDSLIWLQIWLFLMSDSWGIECCELGNFVPNWSHYCPVLENFRVCRSGMVLSPCTLPVLCICYWGCRLGNRS